jgi:hypothetical protein
LNKSFELTFTTNSCTLNNTAADVLTTSTAKISQEKSARHTSAQTPIINRVGLSFGDVKRGLRRPLVTKSTFRQYIENGSRYLKLEIVDGMRNLNEDLAVNWWCGVFS